MKKNLIISILNSILASFLLICAVYGWYVSNKEVSATGIFGSSSSESYNLVLQRGSYDKDNQTWTWVDANSLSFSNISPGNKFFFRIVVDVTKGEHYNFKAEFSEISSSLIENKLVVSDDGEFVASVEAEGQKLNLYQIEEGSIVSVLHETEKKTLYVIQDKKVSLADFKIEDTFLFYSIGANEPSNNELTNYNGVPLKGSTFSFEAVADSNNVYYYFALEFNDEKSIEIIDGVESSNCYMYQRLSIGHIQITCLN